MPHSSGGGHHGGGHHSGSRRRSTYGSYSPNTSRISRRFFQGARRYRYTHFGRTRYCYSDTDPSKRFSPKVLFMAVIYLPFILGIIFLMRNALAPRASDGTIIVKDESNVLGDTSGLYDSLERFREKSGITPAVIAVTTESAQTYSSLEDYAYNRYLSEFDDEMHWLIVYTELPDRSDWSFEGMQGDDTDPVLTPSVTNSFNSDLYDLLENDTVSPRGKIFAEAFDHIIPKIHKPDISAKLKQLLPAFGILFFILFHMYFMLGLNNLKYRNAVYDPEDGAPEADAPEVRYTPDVSGEAKICPSCGMTCDPGEKQCPVCGNKL